MQIENKQAEQLSHNLSIKERKCVTLDGVREVVRFDEHEVLLETACGTLSIDGEGLHLSEWNTERGLATLEGRIDAITYFDKKQEDGKTHNGIWGKLIK